MDGDTVISIFVGGTITWAAAYVYYKRAGDQLRAEADDLAKLHLNGPHLDGASGPRQTQPRLSWKYHGIHL